MKKLILVILCMLVGFLTVPAAAEPIHDTFWATIDPGGGVVGGGSGFNDGEWYFYENTNWWNEWFYSAPYDPTRWKEIDVYVTLMPTGPGSWADVAVNWSSKLYPDGTGQPPLPYLFEGNPELEAECIVRELVFEGEVLGPIIIELGYPIIIPDYNPEWVSIDIRGANIMVYGLIIHECIPEPGTICLLSLGALALLRKRRA